MAIDACTGITGSASLCKMYGCTGGGQNAVICTNVSGQSNCQCWDYTGTHQGFAFQGGSATCFCPGTVTSFPWD
jgi:hypothetical protein